MLNPPKSPDSLGRDYQRFMRSTVGKLRIELGKLLQILFRRTDDEEQDRKTEEVATIIALLLLWWNQEMAKLPLYFDPLFMKVNAFNDAEFVKMVKQLTGLTIQSSSSLPYRFGQTVSTTQDIVAVFGEKADINRTESFIPTVKKTWVENQKAYVDIEIKKAITDIGGVIQTAILMGGVLTALKETLTLVLNAVENRMLKYADRQITLLDSILDRNRGTGFDLPAYQWSTRLDERVRGNPGGKYPKAKPSHYAREGQIFKWANPPTGGHPGEAAGCRCKAIMTFKTS